MLEIIKKCRKMPIHIRAAFWFAFANLISKGMQFISAPIFTMIMNAEEYGRLSVIMSYQQLFYVLATWEIALGAYQRGYFLFEDDKNGYEATTLINITGLVLLFFTIIFALHNYINSLTGLNDSILLALFIYMLSYPPYVCWLISERSEYRYIKVAMMSVCYAFLTTVIPIVAVIIIDNTAEVKYWSTVIPSFIIGEILFLQRFFINRFKLPIHSKIKEYVIFNIKYQGPLIFHGLSYMVLNQSDRIMIGRMVGNSQAAYYSVAYNFAWIGILLQDSIMQAFIPWLYKAMERKEYEQVKRFANFFLFLLAGGLVVYLLVCPEIIMIMFKTEYYEAISCMPAIVVSVFFVFLYNLFANIETFFNETRYIMWVSVFCAGVNIALNYWFIDIYGYKACAYTTLVSYIIFCIGHFVFMRKICLEYDCDYRNLFDYKMIIYISSVVLAIMLITMELYRFPLVRYIAVLGIIILLFLCRKQIFVRIKGLKDE